MIGRLMVSKSASSAGNVIVFAGFVLYLGSSRDSLCSSWQHSLVLEFSTVFICGH
jgi:hypothetical protein